MRSSQLTISRAAAALGAFVAASCTACGDNYSLEMPSPSTPDAIDLRILETTDIHVHLVNYDYYSDQSSNNVGLAKTAALVRTAREEVSNSVLVDNGDLIQGNPLGDYVFREVELGETNIHPVYKAMNLLNYDVGNLGNHEFNYGLEFLDNSLKGANFPYISANVFIDDGDSDLDNDQPYISPYLIKPTRLTDRGGNSHTINIGYIGFVPPQIMTWDRQNLAGAVIAKGIVESALHYVPEMKAMGADIVIAIPHSGVEVSDSGTLAENAVYYLAQVPDIDAILFGHSHQVFPSENFADIADVDVTAGTIHGVPSVMAGFWGSHLGIIDLTLQNINGSWTVVSSKSEARPISTRMDGQTISLVDPEEDIVDAVMSDHMGTIDWISLPIGMINAPIHSFFAQIQDDPSIQIVTDAQKTYVETQIQGTEYADLPVLSAGAPFKAGFGNPDNYTNIAAGTVSYRNIADLYIFPNILKVVKLTGADVREWLERSAGAFRQIEPNSTDKQPLLNPDFPSYNFDVIDGVSYEIDITQPSRYDVDGKLANADAARIVNLMYDGNPIEDEQVFLIATNNYRATGGGNFPGITSEKIVIDAPDENRQVLANYIANSNGVNPTADDNWRIAPINGTVVVTFVTSPKSSAFADAFPRLIATDVVTEEGYIEYRLDLAQ